MKLELKHLAPYLPYSLRIFEGELGQENLIRKMNLGDGRGNSWVGVKTVLRSHQPKYYSFYRPILKHLSNLDCDFEKNTPESIKGCCYSFVEKLFEEHYDVFGLIDEGLAIDKKAMVKEKQSTPEPLEETKP